MYESHWNTLPHKGYSKTNDTLDLSFETLKKKKKTCELQKEWQV